LPAISPTTPPPLQFEFGFATDETPGPGNIFDSFTLTLQDNALNHTVVLLTADANGIVWAPPTPGTLFLDPNSITRSAISFPSLQPILAARSAFQVSVPMPAQFNGLTAKIFVDLFDNLDAVASQGYFRVTAVPEPTVWMIVFVGGLLWLLAGRPRK
jgi:hypothetical protein